jgi:peptidoglycan-associated lipoprotein
MILGYPGARECSAAALPLLGAVLLLAAGDAAARQSRPDAVGPATRDFSGVDQLDRVVYFDLDSAEVRPYAEPRLNEQARWLLQNPSVAVRIEGNTDARGSREYNVTLGARRAEAVRQYLIRRGVAPDRIDTISFGEEQPIAEGLSEDASARNRNTYTAIMPNVSR